VNGNGRGKEGETFKKKDVGGLETSKKKEAKNGYDEPTAGKNWVSQGWSVRSHKGATIQGKNLGIMKIRERRAF